MKKNSWSSLLSGFCQRLGPVSVGLMLGACAPVAYACGLATSPALVPVASSEGTVSVAANSSATSGALSRWVRHFPAVRYSDCRSAVDPKFVFKGLPGAVGTHYEYGQAYSIYPTSVEGVGIIFGIEGRLLAGAGSDPIWRAVLAGVERDSIEERRGRFSHADHGFALFSRLVRIGRITVRGTVTIDPVEAGTARTNWDGVEHPHGAPFGSQSFAVNFRDNPVCSVETSRVPLPATGLDQFPAARGPSSIAHDFDIVLDCESGVGALRYEMTPTGSVDDFGAGIWALDNVADADSAKGVGMQLLRDGGIPLGFSEPHAFGTRTAPGIWSKRFQVRYYRLGSEDVRPGVATASVQMLLIYP